MSQAALHLCVDPAYPADSAVKLADWLAAPIVPSSATLTEGLRLDLHPEGLSLNIASEKRGPGLRVDFSALARRVVQGAPRELIVQAARIRQAHRQQQIPPVLIDATAGFGEDAFILASAGFEVLLFERNKVLAAMLAEGLGRAASSKVASICARMRLRAEDSLAYMQALEPQTAQVIYLDPMFQDIGQAAKVKKKLQILQALMGGELSDADALLLAAIRALPKKIVVKRPLRGTCLLNLTPSYALKGRSIRFDVYLPASMRR